MKRFLTWTLAALLVLALMLALGRAYKARQQPAAPGVAAQTPATIELAASDVSPVQMQDLAQGLPVSGTLKAVHSAVIKARVAGELTVLSVREGDMVQAGQVLGKIEASDYQSRLQQAEQQADAAKAQGDIAQRQYDNNKALVDQNFISKTALDSSLATLQAAQATYRAALAAAQIARKSLEDTVIRAPLSGQVAQRLAQPGERVAVDARILEIVDLRQLELEASLAAADSLALQIGQSAELRIEGSRNIVKARLARINPSAQAGSRSVMVYLSIVNPASPDLPLRQGLFAEGMLGTNRVRTLAVPVSSVRMDQPQPYVQWVSQDKIIHQPVVLGARAMVDSDLMVAVQGLPEGALIVRSAAGLLRAGSAVRFTPITGGPAQATAAPAAAARPAR
jgi:RND family efflux transporter MFP subunit